MTTTTCCLSTPSDSSCPSCHPPKQAHCSTFNLVDEVYRFTLKNVRFKMEGAETVNVPTLKIISVKSNHADELSGPASQSAARNAKKAAAVEAKPLAQRDSPAPQKGKTKGKKKAG